MGVLITANYPKWALDELAAFGPVQYEPWQSRGRLLAGEELAALMRDTKSDILITEVDRVGDALFAATPVRAIGVCRGTPVNVDLPAATARKIPVFRTPGRNAQAVAELCLAFALMGLRGLWGNISWVKEGHWTRSEMTLERYNAMRGHELAGKTVGLMGFGAVGQAFARLLLAFPATVLFHDPFPRVAKDLVRRVESVSPERLFKESDIVSIHLPALPSTKHLVGRALLEEMAPHALLINSSRAAVIDREALTDVLRSGRIAGAALDVFDHEPLDDPGDQELMKLPGVIATPHIGGATDEVSDHQARILNQALAAWAKGETDLPELANPEIFGAEAGTGKGA